VTTAEYILKLQELHGVQGSIVKYTIAPSAKELLAAIKKRIFTDGLNSNNSQIGNYSTVPVYATRKQFTKPGAFVPQGETQYLATIKRGDKTYQRKAKVKTMYLPEGYKQLRDIQGLPTDKVNLKYSGKTQKAYIMEETTEAVLLGLNTYRASGIRSKQERRFNAPIFIGTETELRNYINSVNLRVERILRGVLIEGQSLKPNVGTYDYERLF